MDEGGIEIRELIIKATVDNSFFGKLRKAKEKETITQKISFSEREALIMACVDRVMELLEHQQER